MANPTYTTGTVSIDAGDTVLVGTGTIWSGGSAKAGDTIYIDGVLPGVDIEDVTDATHLTLPAPWAGGAKSGVTYKIVQNYPARVVGVAAAEDVGVMLAQLNSLGPIFNVPVGETVPDPSYGTDGQYAVQMTTGQWWLKTAGVWVLTTAPLAGYGGTSATSLVIANSVTRVFTTQANLAYNGARVRAASAAAPANYMEGVCTYSGSTLTMTVDAIGGSGTKADWVFSIAGQPLTGALLAANNGSDFANVDTTLGNLHGVSYGASQSLTAAQKAQARANLDLLKKNYILNGAMMVSQENGTTAGAATGYYPVDQFGAFFSGTTGVYSTAQVASVTAAGSPNRLRVTVSTADAAVAAGDAVYIITRLEGLRVADIAYGTAVAKTTTLRFGVKAPAGTYCVTFINNAANRSYVAEYTISVGEANTDVYKSITIPGDTSGTWLKDTGAGIEVRWGLMVGSTLQQAAGSWGTGNVLGSSNQFNFMGTISNVFELFDVGLYDGGAAPAFQVPDYASELQLCKRYFQIRRADASTAQYLGPFQSYATTGAIGLAWTIPVELRATPTITISAAGDFSLTDGGTTPRACVSHSFTATSTVVMDNAIIGTANLSPPGLSNFVLNAGSGWLKANARV